MLLNLTEKQKSYIKVTYNPNRFEVKIGEIDPIHREYYSVADMLKEFVENEIKKAEFDDRACYVFNQGDQFITERDENEILH